MKLALTVVCLFGLALGNMESLSDADTDMVNKMMDVIEGGLKRDTDADEKARALFISLTLTSTTTNLATATITTTETASCVTNVAGGAFTECTDATATTARSLLPRNGDFIVDHIIQMSDENMDGEFMAVAEEYDEFEGDVTVHKVVNGQSQKVSISEILPTRVRNQQYVCIISSI